jgi:type I restriction enzyme, S subunit
MPENSNIPDHWQIKKLGEVCDIQTGKFDANHANPEGKFRFYTCAHEHLLCNTNRFKGESLILPGNGANVGEVFYYNGEFDAYQRTYVINGIKAIPKFLYYHLLCYWGKRNEDKQFGSATNYIRMANFTDYLIPFPPLIEQIAIVSKIEELFSDLENGKQQLLTAQQQLKIYRQSLLKWAFEGRLTNKNVKDGELPEGWKVVDLKDIVEKISDGPFGSNLKSIDYVGEGIRVIRLENIGELEFRNENKSFITPSKYETIKKHTVGKGDIIFSSFISDNIRSVILPDYIDIAINKADCFLVRVSESKVNRKYLAYYFATKAMRNQLVDQIHGATRPRINTTQLKASFLPFAPLTEQHLIVDELESKLTVCDKVEETINQNLQQAETLRQSILKRAFEGRLV